MNDELVAKKIMKSLESIELLLEELIMITEDNNELLSIIAKHNNLVDDDELDNIASGTTRSHPDDDE